MTRAFWTPERSWQSAVRSAVRYNTMDKNVRKYIKVAAVVYLVTTVTLVSLGLITWVAR